ncbi:helix-turn-helix domain-containing protein [Verrucosispora sioxanthis]|uniref:Helix-turn-helix domain-containing protein n=1 Tax=Verrucosispora sioxanthis TaxID=2499994 RepID=A0A6M1L724_9ACTN|nr:helix-turn-helix domain-containing protein [Verrucosispora sioxanthis]NEE63193.1 helix-turn-helix domain-containing protein [Verrucosispora sioxanthis]NGM12303.1 helix-turn-helix domain-containing protein [Verrucosispora sioxanthis]
MTAFDATEVRRLRTEEQLSVREIRARTGLGRNRIHELLRGVPAPERTRRPRAKDDLRTEAVALRSTGHAVPEIARRLGVSRSTAYLWVRHIPLKRDPEEERERRRAHSKTMADARWADHRRARDEARAEAHAVAAKMVGQLDERDLLIVGAAVYWCEGTKSKPWRRDDHVQFVNSDPGLLALFLRFLEVCGVDPAVPTYRVSIHETADPDAAAEWWAVKLGVPRERFRRATLKKHKPATVRRNTGDEYRGCLVINVPRSRELYWRIEGMIAELFRSAAERACVG